MFLPVSCCFMLALSGLGISQASDIKICSKPNTFFRDAIVDANFIVESVLGDCNPRTTLCADVLGHTTTFSIPAGTSVAPGTKQLDVSDGQEILAYIPINGNQVNAGIPSLGRLPVQDDKVAVNTDFIAHFFVKDTIPKVTLSKLKVQSVIKLAGPLGDAPVNFIFAQNADKSGKRYTLTVDTTCGALAAPHCEFPRLLALLVLAQLITRM